MKLTAIIAAAVVSLLAIAYTVIFILVRAQVGQEFDFLDITTIVRDPGDAANSGAEQLTIKNGAAYGWLCILKTTSSDLSWQESLTIPSRPASWRHRNLVRVSMDGRTAYSSGEGVIASSRTFSELLQRLCFVKTVFLYNEWSVVEGDPIGDYVFTVTYDGKTVTKTIRLITD